MEEKRQLAADAVLSGARVVEDEDAQLLRVVEDLEHGVRVRVGQGGLKAAEPGPVVPRRRTKEKLPIFSEFIFYF